MKRIKKILKNQYVSGVIIGVFLIFLTTFISYVKSLSTDESFTELFKTFWTYKIELWLILLIIFVISILIIFIIQFFKKKKSSFKYDSNSVTLDRKLFNRIIKELLPQDGTILWLRTHNFGSSFPDIRTDPLYTFETENLKSDFEFLNPKLEKLKTELLNSILTLNKGIATHTFEAGPDFQSIPSEWKTEQRERYTNAVDELNKLGGNVCVNYDILIKTCRRIIKN